MNRIKVYIQSADMVAFVMRFSGFIANGDCRCDGFCLEGKVPSPVDFMAKVRSFCTQPPVFELPESKELCY
jgi:hypothetical protein